MTVSGVPWLWPYASQLVAWGANDGARLILRHEYWRLPASVFIHGGLIHLAVNMWSLWVIGPLVERIYGHMTFAVLYLAAGIGGAIASAAVPPVRASVGASGAICGILGGLLAFLLAHRRTIPPTVLRQLLKSVLMVVAFMAVLGVVVPGIDQAAHLGGLAVGFGSGLLLIGPWPVEPRLRLERIGASGRDDRPDRRDAVGLGGRPGASRQRRDSPRAATLRTSSSSSRRSTENPPPSAWSSPARPTSSTIVMTPRDSRPPGAVPLATRRAVANAGRMQRVCVRDPELKAVCDEMAVSLSALIERLDALDRYVETGDPAAFAAARNALARFQAALHNCEELQIRYLIRHRLAVPTRVDPPE